VSERDEVIAGRYRLVALVGRGAGGVVWRARDERLGRAVAIKFLGAGSGSGGSPDAVNRTLREGRVAAQLRHPHAVTVHDVVEHGGKPCLVMEYLPSRTLAELIDERGPLPEALVAGVGWQVASALTAAHAVGIVHRDVSTFNILLADDGTAKIADFGIARAIGEGTVTDARAVVGTPAFLAPEVAAGEGAVFASDVYSLGATLYTALEGHPPIGTTDNPYALLRRASEAEVAPLRFPGPLGDVLMRVLRREPMERPTMAEMHELLGAVVEGRALPGVQRAMPGVEAAESVAAPVPERVGGTMPLVMPRRVLWRRISVVVGAVALVAGGVVVFNSLLGDESVDRGLIGPTGRASTSSTSAVPTSAASASDDSPDTNSATSSAECDADFRVTTTWPGGYQAVVTVRNAAERPLGGWTVSWPQPAGHVISNLWNGTFTAESGSVRVTNADHNAKLPVDGSTSFGFTANGPVTLQPDVTCRSGQS
jgi:serine/threonine protein kinase